MMKEILFNSELEEFFKLKLLLRGDSLKICEILINTNFEGGKQITVSGMLSMNYQTFSDYLPNFSEYEKMNFFEIFQNRNFNLPAYLLRKGCLDKYYEICNHINVEKKIDLEDLKEMDIEEFLLLKDNYESKEFMDFYEQVVEKPIEETQLSAYLKTILSEEEIGKFIKIIKLIRNNKISKKVKELVQDDLMGNGISINLIEDFLNSLFKKIYADNISQIFFRFNYFLKFKNIIDFLISLNYDLENLIKYPNYLKEVLHDSFLHEVEYLVNYLKFIQAFRLDIKYDSIIEFLLANGITFDNCIDLIKKSETGQCKLDMFIYLKKFQISNWIGSDTFEKNFQNLTEIDKIFSKDKNIDFNIDEDCKKSILLSLNFLKNLGEQDFLKYEYVPKDYSVNEISLNSQDIIDTTKIWSLIYFSEKIKKFSEIILKYDLSFSEHKMYLDEEDISNDIKVKHFIEIFNRCPLEMEKYAIEFSKNNGCSILERIPRKKIKLSFQIFLDCIENELSTDLEEFNKKYRIYFENYETESFRKMIIKLVLENIKIYDLIKKLLLNNFNFIFYCIFDQNTKKVFTFDGLMYLINSVNRVVLTYTLKKNY